MRYKLCSMSIPSLIQFQVTKTRMCYTETLSGSTSSHEVRPLDSRVAQERVVQPVINPPLQILAVLTFLHIQPHDTRSRYIYHALSKAIVHSTVNTYPPC